MAKQIEAGKFLVIECTAGELMNAIGSDICICDWCGRAYLPSDKGCYIAVLNQWYCQECYNEWIDRMVWSPEDADVQRMNFEFYAPLLGVKC
jgi:hypothetical protein